MPKESLENAGTPFQFTRPIINFQWLNVILWKITNLLNYGIYFVFENNSYPHYGF